MFRDENVSAYTEAMTQQDYILDFSDNQLAEELMDFTFGDLGFGKFDELLDEIETRLLEKEVGLKPDESAVELIQRLRDNRHAAWKRDLINEIYERLIS